MQLLQRCRNARCVFLHRALVSLPRSPCLSLAASQRGGAEKGAQPAQPEKYDYIVWYAAEGKNPPLRVENTAESKTIVDGAYDIVKYSNSDAFPDNLFDDPCPASVGANKTDISCKSASGGPGGACGAQDDSCCDGPPGVGQSCYASATQDCCTDGPGKGHVCAKGKCSTRAGFICD